MSYVFIFQKFQNEFRIFKNNKKKIRKYIYENIVLVVEKIILDKLKVVLH